MKTMFETNLMEALASLSWRHEVPERRKKYASLTEHITNDRDRRITECLCENQLGRIKAMELNEATNTTDVALFKKYALKVIPRVYPALVIKDLISIQPIPLPTAKVFYKDFVRDPAGTSLADSASFDRTYGNRGSSPVEQPVSTTPPGVGPTSVVTGEGATPAKIKLKLTSIDISATSKAFTYEFSAELNQDLMAYHGISADPELASEAAKEIQREVEQDIIYMLLTGAGAGNVNWSAQPPAADTTSVNIEAYNRTLYHALIDARNLVFKKRYAYPNWCITHPDVAARLEKLNGFEYDPSFDPATVMQGRQFFGTIRNVLKIYVDPWFPYSNKALLGFKGVGDFDVGAVYAPYIPFYSTQLFENPATLVSSRSLLSRQASALLIPDMYATVTITNAS